MRFRNRTVLPAWIAVLLSGSVFGQAQSTDLLIDKLIQKGILTQDEARALREEASQGANAAEEPGPSLPDWLESMTLKGDFRGRYDAHFPSEGSATDRHAFRYRFRLGAVFSLSDNFEIGFRVASGEPNESFGGNPISGNTSFRDNGSKKFIWIDQAYGSWMPLKGDPLEATFTVGKMENPFEVSDLIFDSDYTPEGFGVRLAYDLDSVHTLALNAGGFALDELSGSADDPFLFGAQLRHEAEWNDRWKSALGLAGFAITATSELSNTAVPNINTGNARTDDGILANHFNPVVADLEIVRTFESAPFYPGKFPVSLRGEVLHNPAASDNKNGAAATLRLGKSGRKGEWELSYRYRYVEADAWYEEFLDSDSGAYYGASLPGSGRDRGFGAGTNLKGHTAEFSYSPYDSIVLGVTWFFHELIHNPAPGTESDLQRVQVDATWKF